jgi:hydroxymethylbilane synthase
LKAVVIGTRGSTLALIQAEIAKAALESAFPERTFILKVVKTTGDLVTDIPLEKIGDKGIFIRELENALGDNDIDLAVHSMKDMPTTLPGNLAIGAMLSREEPWDVVIAAEPSTRLDAMRPGSCIGSSSLRRRSQLLRHYPHLNIQSIRGNLDTRLKKLRQGEFRAIVLAWAGVKRMGWTDQITEKLSGTICLPAVGQGAIGIEIRKDDEDTVSLVAALNCPQTEMAVKAERAFLRRLEGGCQVPVGALAELSDGELVLEGMVASVDGVVMFRDTERGDPARAEAIGLALAEKLLQHGCGSILEQIRQECGEK